MTWLDKKTDRVILRGIISNGNDDLPEIYADLKVKSVIHWIMRKTKQCPNKTCLEKKCMTGDKLDAYTKRRFYQDKGVKQTSEEFSSEKSSSSSSSDIWD